MKIVGLVFADFEQTFLGGRSQLRTQLGSAEVLAHTLRRLEQVDGLDNRAVVVRSRDADAARAALREYGMTERFEVLELDSGMRPRLGLHQAARKWNLESWRGGLLGATWFDEFVDPATVGRVLNHFRCAAALCVEGHQAALAPEIASAMVAHQREYAEEALFVFTQASPGLAGMVLTTDAIRELLQLDIPPGLLLSYRPELAQLDPITKSTCLHVTPEVGQTRARFSADTRRGRERLGQAFAELGPEASAGALCAWVRDPVNDRAGILPVEIELELTTADPFPNSRLRPRGRRVPQRELTDFRALERIFVELGEYDDRLLFLGGHGDPLEHPRFGEICEMARAAGICGIGLATTGLRLSEAVVEGLIAAQVDAVEVQLDATTAATYGSVHGEDRFAEAQSGLSRLDAARRSRSAPQPLPVPSLTRCSATIGEMEDFFERWIRTSGSAVLNGYNEYGGLLPSDGLLATVSPLREPCRRLAERLTLLADGTVGQCHQDVAGRYSLGNWRESPLRDIWNGGVRRKLLGAHQRLELIDFPMCVTCQEWARP